MRTLILGLGNLVHADDGAGIHAVERLRTDPRVPPDVVIIDGGTQGLSLLPHISGFERLLVIDAVDAGEPPGTLLRLEGRALADMPGRSSVHQLGFSDLMVAMKLLGDLPAEVIVFGVQPMSTEWSAELSPPVEEAIGPLIDSVLEQLEAWQPAIAANVL